MKNMYISPEAELIRFTPAENLAVIEVIASGDELGN